MQALVLGEFALLLGFELSSVIVDSLKFKRGFRNREREEIKQGFSR